MPSDVHLPWAETLLVGALRGRSADWPDDLWAGSMSWVDWLLRVYYGIYEFADDPDCILRVAIGRSRAPVSLADGTRIKPGEPVGTLHCWNQHMPRYPIEGPDLGWAGAIRQRTRHSLMLLAEHIEKEPAWREVRALCGEAALSTRLGLLQVQRVAERYGFERLASTAPTLGRLHALAESCHLWGLTRAFNPAALPRQPFRRDHHELWISRAALLLHYGCRRRSAEGRRHGSA